MKEKIKKFVASKNFMIILSFLGLYLIATGISLAVFTLLKKEQPKSANTSTGETGRAKIDVTKPKTEICPINGEKFTKEEEAIWKDRRPLTIMVENHVDSRPPSGLSKADVVYEAVAEGGITRFLSVFYCRAAAEDVRVGPVRSARIYFIDWASEYGKFPLYVHVGGANNICSNCPGGVKPAGTVAKEVRALEKLIEISWRYKDGNALDGGANAGIPEMWRDYERIPNAATEHTYMGSTDKLAEVGKTRGFGYKDKNGSPWISDFTPWKFIEGAPESSPAASVVSFKFWNNKPDYDVEWKYDKTNNQYLRFNGGKAHIDMDNKQQLSAKNVVIQFVKEVGPVDKEGHMFYTTIGKGKVIVFQNGKAIEGTWEKTARTSRTIFKDAKGKEISFVSGVIWIEAVPMGNTIDYQ